MTRLRSILLVMLLGCLPTVANAWWNAEWSNRRPIAVDAAPSGADLKEGLTNLVVPVRLHTGNFPFLEAKEDGSDLRLIAGDDKTPLKFHIEKFDAVNELAILWVQLPRIAAGAKSEPIWLYWGNTKAQAAGDSKSTFDATYLAVYHFAERTGAPVDATASGLNAARASGLQPVGDGPIGSAVAFDGSGSISIGPAPALKLAGGTGLTFSAWIRPAQAQTATLFALGREGAAVEIALDGSQVVVRGADKAEVRGGEVPPGRWSHVAVVLADQTRVYVDGREAAAGALKGIEAQGEATVGGGFGTARGFEGAMDEVQLSPLARSEGWIRGAWASQAQDAKLLTYGEAETTEGGSSYLTILLDAVTIDGWVVIVILMVMLVVSFVVMIGKAIVVGRVARANDHFMERFRQIGADLTALAPPEPGASAGSSVAPAAAASGLSSASSLYTLYITAVREARIRIALYRTRGVRESLTPQALSAIRASLDADLTRETQRLNNQMVLLTIAISGGPFLGLLGTVVGVMITFAAIAAAGDVNVNAIAPGIAAALVATVAGLAVAIPALFGYNYLTSRIRDISTDMQVFSDEILTKLAEQFAD